MGELGCEPGQSLSKACLPGHQARPYPPPCPKCSAGAPTTPLLRRGEALLLPLSQLRPPLSPRTCSTHCPDRGARGCSRRHGHHLPTGVLSPLMIPNHTLSCHCDVPKAMLKPCLYACQMSYQVTQSLPGLAQPLPWSPSLEERHQTACHTHIPSVPTTVQRPPSLSPGVPHKLLTLVPNP